MKQFLIKTSTNWADEIDLHGWLILDENDLAAAKQKLQPMTDDDFTAELYVGTNEEIEVDADDVLNELNSAIELTPEEAHTLTKFFGLSYGFSLYDRFIRSSDVEDWYEEIEERKKEDEEQRKIDARFDEVKNLFD